MRGRKVGCCGDLPGLGQYAVRWLSSFYQADREEPPVIARDNNISLALGIPGLLIQVVGVVMRSKPETEANGQTVAAIGTILLICGLGFYAKAKGRSIAWGLMGFLSIIGLIVLAMLEDRAPSGKVKGQSKGKSPRTTLGPGEYPPRR
jgi:hypothetical protein